MPGFNRSIKHVRCPPGLAALEFVPPSTVVLWKNDVADRDSANDGADQDAVSPRTDRDFGDGGFHDRFGLVGLQGCFDQALGQTLPPSLETLRLSESFD